MTTCRRGDEEIVNHQKKKRTRKSVEKTPKQKTGGVVREKKKTKTNKQNK